jgi:hypothetical protein
VDWLLNTVGGLVGAVLSAWLEQRGWLYHWVQFRRRWLLPHASGSLVFMALWPLALLFPTPLFLGLGNVAERLLVVVEELFPHTTWTAELAQQFFLSAALPAWLEMLSVAGNLCVVAMLGMAVMRQAWQRLCWVGTVVLLAVLSNALSASVTYGPEHIVFWFTPVTGAGLALGCLAALLTLRLSATTLLCLMLLLQVVVLCVVNLVPPSTYFAQTVQTWEQGKFIRFHGLTEWLSWAWPFALLVWGVLHLLSDTARHEAA